MNRLEEQYGLQIDFRWIDAYSTQGGAAFRHYQLFGHPGYVILNPDGQVLWTSIGEQSSDVLEEQFLTVLNGL